MKRIAIVAVLIVLLLVGGAFLPRSATHAAFLSLCGRSPNQLEPELSVCPCGDEGRSRNRPAAPARSLGLVRDQRRDLLGR